MHRTPLLDPACLLAIARAARLAGDRNLERGARRLLAEKFGIEVRFNDSRLAGQSREENDATR